MLKTVSLQASVALVVALIASLIGGTVAGWSALLGGLACVVPNALFALRLGIQMRRPGGAQVMTFFGGEFVKLVLTVAILAVIALRAHDLNWLAMLTGFIVALKSYFVAFLFDRNK